MMKALMATDLPLPVDPAMSRCGMEFISVVIRRPLMSLPRAMLSLGFGGGKLRALHHLAQPDGFALFVGNLDADGGFSGHALDQDALGAHGEAEVVLQVDDAAVLDARLGLELEGGDDRAGIDLHHRAQDAELFALLGQGQGQLLQLLLVVGHARLGTVQQGARRQLPRALLLGQGGAGLGAVIAALRRPGCQS